MIVSGLANLRASTGWRAGDALWAGLATHCTRCVRTMRVHQLANTAHGFAKVDRRAPACLILRDRAPAVCLPVAAREGDANEVARRVERYRSAPPSTRLVKEI